MRLTNDSTNEIAKLMRTGHHALQETTFSGHYRKEKEIFFHFINVWTKSDQV